MAITIGGPPAPSDDVKRALKFASDLIEYLEELPVDALDFAESVEGKTRGIIATIERTRRVTTGQWTALENMRDGAERWTHRD